MVGVGTHKGATVLALPAAIDSPEVLGGLGEALIARLGCAGCVVVDSDEGKDVIRGWNGGEALTAHTGWFAWDAPANRCFAIGLPPHATAAPSGLAAELTKALPWTVREAGGRVTGVTRRDGGSFVRTLPGWRVEVELPEHPPVPVFVDVPPTLELAERVAWLVPDALDGVPALAARTYPASDELRAEVVRRVPVALDGLERRGFQHVQWTARIKLDGVGATLEFATLVPSDDPEDDMIDRLAEAIADERDARGEQVRESLDDALARHLAAGELDAAAATYRALHAAYFATLPDDQALSASNVKVRELARLYRR
jgi:hypothetical protein